MHNARSGRLSATYQRILAKQNAAIDKAPTISDDARNKLVLEMRDRIFNTCKKDLLRYSDLMMILGLSRDQAFVLMKHPNFPVTQINGRNAVTAIALAHWMLGAT